MNIPLRDYFAGQIAAGMMATNGFDHGAIGRIAYSVADKMLAARGVPAGPAPAVEPASPEAAHLAQLGQEVLDALLDRWLARGSEEEWRAAARRFDLAEHDYREAHPRWLAFIERGAIEPDHAGTLRRIAALVATLPHGSYPTLMLGASSAEAAVDMLLANGGAAFAYDVGKGDVIAGAELKLDGLDVSAQSRRPAAPAELPAPVDPRTPAEIAYAEEAAVLGLDVEEAPHVCPGCHAVGGEHCAPGCIDAEMAEARERDDEEPAPDSGVDVPVEPRDLSDDMPF